MWTSAQWEGGGTITDDRVSVISAGEHNSLCCSPDGTCLLSVGSAASAGEATVFGSDLTVKGVLRAPHQPDQSHVCQPHYCVHSVATDGTHHVTGDGDGYIKLWDAATLVPIAHFRHGMSRVNGLAARDDVLVSGSADGTAAVWSIALCR